MEEKKEQPDQTGQELVVRESSDFVYSRMRGDPLTAAATMGAALAKSKLFGIDAPEQGMVLALEAMHQQRSVMDLAREFHVIKGRLSMRADAMQAKFQRDGGKVTWLESTADVARVQVSHPIHAPEPVAVEVLMATLKAAGVATSDTYKKFPRQMLRARAISEAVRMVHPGIVVGIYTPEEVEGFDAPTMHVQPRVIDVKAEPAPAQKPAATKSEPAPAAAQNGNRKLTIEERRAKVLENFTAAGLSRETIIALADDPPEEWGDAHFARLNAARERFKGQPRDQVPEIARAILAERRAEEQPAADDYPEPGSNG